MKREGSAHWEGDLKSGTGTVSTQSGALDDQPYGFNTRFEDGKGTNPEELIGAAHASCFSMALSMILGEAGFKPDSIDTKAIVTLDKQSDGFAITAIHLDVKASIPKASESDFSEAANTAKENCPISKVLDADISMKATLES